MPDQAANYDNATGAPGGGPAGPIGRKQADRSALGMAVSPLRVASCAPGGQLWADTVASIWPWRRGGYRGWSVAAADALSYSPRTLRAWLQTSSRGVSHAASLRIIALLEARIGQATQLLHAWRLYAAERERLEATTPAPFSFRSMRAHERDGWRSKPRVARKKG